MTSYSTDIELFFVTLASIFNPCFNNKENKTMRKTTIIALLATLLVCMSCGDGEYKEADGTICYTYWTFSFGTLSHPLPEVDPATFVDVKDWLGHDDRHVYFKQHLVKGADAATLKAKKYPLFCDKNDYYYMTAPLHVADVKTFKVVKQFEDNIWAKDSRYAYFDSLRIDSVDVKTFRVKSYSAAIDKDHVFYYGKILPLADPKTYDAEWKWVYSRDKSHIWYCGELLKDVDYDSFEVDKEGNASDKFGKFKGSERLK